MAAAEVWARPHPSPEPARWSASTSGGGQGRTTCQDRAARHVRFIGWNRPSGHLNVHSGSGQARSARGGAAAAVLGRHGGGWVAMARGSVSSGHSCGPKGGEGGVRKRRKRGECEAAEGNVLSFDVLSAEATCLVFFGGKPSSRSSESFTDSEVSSRGYTRYPSPGRRQGRDRRVEAVLGDGRGRHRRAGGWCSATSAGVRRRPEPSLRHGCAIRNRCASLAVYAG